MCHLCLDSGLPGDDSFGDGATGAGAARGAALAEISSMKHSHLALKTERVIYNHLTGLTVASTAILVALWAVAKHFIDRRHPL